MLDVEISNTSTSGGYKHPCVCAALRSGEIVLAQPNTGVNDDFLITTSVRSHAPGVRAFVSDDRIFAGLQNGDILINYEQSSSSDDDSDGDDGKNYSAANIGAPKRLSAVLNAAHRGKVNALSVNNGLNNYLLSSSPSDNAIRIWDVSA